MTSYRHATAIEMRMRWLKWLAGPGERLLVETSGPKLLPAFRAALERGDTFYMEPQFCGLVEHARATIPDDLPYEAAWLHAPSGWMWLETPFLMPRVYQQDTHRGEIRIHAVGWRETAAGQIQVTAFQRSSDYVPGSEGFAPWSCFLLRDGDVLGERIREFEDAARTSTGGHYIEGRDADQMHEIRWVYAALHLMAQRLAVTVQHATDRVTRRRAERDGMTPPPFVHAITLRRLQQAREQAGAAVGGREWNWQWLVGGHWRNQWFPASGTHRPVFIDSYIKGPGDKPLKPETTRIYVARR